MLISQIIWVNEKETKKLQNNIVVETTLTEKQNKYVENLCGDKDKIICVLNELVNK